MAGTLASSWAAVSGDSIATVIIIPKTWTGFRAFVNLQRIQVAKQLISVNSKGHRIKTIEDIELSTDLLLRGYEISMHEGKKN